MVRTDGVVGSFPSSEIVVRLSDRERVEGEFLGVSAVEALDLTIQPWLGVSPFHLSRPQGSGLRAYEFFSDSPTSISPGWNGNSRLFEITQLLQELPQSQQLKIAFPEKLLGGTAMGR